MKKRSRSDSDVAAPGPGVTKGTSSTLPALTPRRASLDNDAQVQKLEKRIDLWKTELDAARAAIPDKQLRWAIGFVMFNYHHDRGFPMVPSSYTSDEATHQVPQLLYMMLKLSNQPVGFDKPQATLAKAQEWLNAFWAQRLMYGRFASVCTPIVSATAYWRASTHLKNQ